MNILFLYGGAINPERGGVQRVTEVLADEFARRGDRVLEDMGDCSIKI